MSFDVYIRPTDPDAVEYWCGNITANLGAFFAWALHGTRDDAPLSRCDSRDGLLAGKKFGDGLPALDGLTVAELRPLVRDALARVDDQVLADPHWLKRFDAENGWGSWKGGVRYLGLLRDACEHFEWDDAAAVRVSW
jgi:hypothetical protein